MLLEALHQFRALHALRIRVVTNCRVTQIDRDRVVDKDGNVYPSNLCVWAAGIKAPDLLASLGLPTARGGQVEVDPQLRVKGAADIYALGDCAACVDGKGNAVPPRAQAAHQQASHMVRQVRRRLLGEPLRPFAYRDFGSLVSFGEYSTVGNLMGFLAGKSMMIEGFFARMMYRSLYKMHERALHGTAWTALNTVARALTRRTDPRVKLH